MALKSIRSILLVSFIAVLFTSLFSVNGAYALSKYQNPSDLPLLPVFVSQVKNGQAGELRGIYVPDIFAVPVVQQPAGNNGFVSPRQNIITQFNLAARSGSTGLLAHNYLLGEKFFLLEKDQKVYLIYGDGQITTFRITEILRYQALDPNSTSSKFVSLEDNHTLSSAELFSKVYGQPGNVVFQTCIAKNDIPSWGRIFVIAEPYSSKP